MPLPETCYKPILLLIGDAAETAGRFQEIGVNGPNAPITDAGAFRAAENLASVPMLATRKRQATPTMLAVARQARRQGYTHLILLQPTAECSDWQLLLNHLLEAGRQSPQAIIVGYRPGRSLTGRLARRWRRLWFRIQTGQVLPDSESDGLVCPLQVFEHLSLWHWQYTLSNQLLVKAAWSGVRLHPTELPPSPARRCCEPSLLHHLHRELQLALLNIQLSLRAVLPWPRKPISGLSSLNDPPISLRHPIQSLRRLRQQHISPRHIASAAALGVFLGTLPLFALHSVAILFTAGYLGLNRLVALSASQLCMPPVVPALCISVGYYLRHGHWLTELSIRTLGYQAPERLLEWLLGALLLAPLLALGVGGWVWVMAHLVLRRAS